MGLLSGLRNRLEAMFSGRTSGQSGDTPVFRLTSASQTNRLSEWDEGRIMRNLAVFMGAGLNGKHSFGGPKRLAFERMLSRAEEHGSVIVLVLPESPLYTQRLLNPTVRSAFDALLQEIAKKHPKTKWVRLDHRADLQSNELYADLSHMNAFGCALATQGFLSELTPAALHP